PNHAHQLLPNPRILTNMIEVLHKRLIDIHQRSDSLRYRQHRETPDLLNDMRRGIHTLLGKVLAEIGEPGALFSKLLLLWRQRTQPLLVLIAVIDWPAFAA